MICHWELKNLEFNENGQQVLEGISSNQRSVLPISPEQVVKWHKGNDIWAMAVVHHSEDSANAVPPLDIVQAVLLELKDV
jgi:hypothetical protein